MSTPPPAGLAGVLDALEKLHGEPPPPPTTEPLELVLWENVAYLADDRRREDAFAALKKRVGTRPERILSARRECSSRSPGRGSWPGTRWTSCGGRRRSPSSSSGET